MPTTVRAPVPDVPATVRTSLAAPSPARPIPPRRAALLACAAALLTGGCGQRGPLYLPENAPPPRRRRPAPQPEADEPTR
ncbi:MAG TPA: lipoprotein [Zeimonas sp.]|nr:lipoprotein [Zeimonas sp.]